MKNKKYLNKMILGDILEVLPALEDESVDIVLTDPPYFLDKLDNNWNHKEVNNKKNQQVVKSLPAGMKFDRKQGQNFYQWYFEVSKELYRILKSGGFFFSFSSPRLYHRMASAADDVGFEIRDCFLWLYTQNQPKAMSLSHFVDKLDISSEQKAKIKKQLAGWKTPQLKSCFEPIMMAQKPTDGTFLNNMLVNNIGLVNTEVKVGNNMFPSNVLASGQMNEIIDKFFLVKKPDKEEKGGFNGHKTVKPLEICEHILKLTAFYKNAVVLDPFVGSGTTAIAARNLNLNYIGIDINPEYIKIAQERIDRTRKGSRVKTTKQNNIFDFIANKIYESYNTRKSFD